MTAAVELPAKSGHAIKLAEQPLCILAAHALAMTLVLIPVLLTRIPPLVDYPNHLARMSILATIGDRPALQDIYRVDWALLPNLVMDLTVPLLGQAIGIEAAGRAFIIATLLSLAIGTAMLHYAVHRRLSLWPLTIYLFLYNGILAYGFLNYLFGIGLGLIFFALWITTRDWPAYYRQPIFVAGVLLLLLCHLAAVATLAVCIGGYELWRWRNDTHPSLARLLRATAWAILPFVPSLLLLVFAGASPPGDAGIEYNLIQGKIRAIWAPFTFMLQGLDPIFGITMLVVLFGGLKARRLMLAAPLVVPIMLLALSIIVVPTWLYDNWANDRRLAIPLTAVLIAAMSGRWPARKGALLAMLALGFFAYRIVAVSYDWPKYDALFTEFRQAAAALPPRAKLLPASDWSAPPRPLAPQNDARPFYHVVTLALLDRDVFVPTLFTAQGRQILTVQPEFEPLDVPHSKPIPKDHLRDLLEPGSEIQPFGSATKVRHYPRFAGWPYHYDYLLLVDFGRHDNPLPEILQPFRQGSYFVIYKINPSSRSPSAAP